MSSTDIIKNQLQNGALGHAYLFSGTDQEAKKGAVEKIVTHFLGTSYTAHPDFFEVSEQPIGVEAIARLKNRAAQTPLVAAKKVFLVRCIETLTRDAAPALLKTLEDPGDYNIFIAETTHFESVLPTIRSRCSHMHFLSQTIEHQVSNSLVADIVKMPYQQRFERVPKLIETESLETFVHEALWHTEQKIRTTPTALPASNAPEITRLEQMLRAAVLLKDPVVNKRLVGEYIMMIL